MPLLLVILFIVVPIAELALLIQVGQLIGVWWTVALLIADALLGSWLLRTQSRAAWRRFNEALGRGRLPHREVIDGVLVIFGGVAAADARASSPTSSACCSCSRPRACCCARLLVRRGALQARRRDARARRARPTAARAPTTSRARAVDVDSDR